MLIWSGVRRGRAMFFAALVAVSLVATSLAVVGSPEVARAEVTGTGGQYVPASVRVLDTRTTIGGTPGVVPANTWRSLQVTGVGGVPAQNVGAVTLTVTAVDPGTTAQVMGRPDASQPSTLVMVYEPQNTSNTVTLAVSATGKVELLAETAINLVVDVQGYYTSTENGVADGGFVPLSGARLADTRSGEGINRGSLAPGATMTTQVTGKAGVPAGASAVVANFIVINEGSGKGNFTPYAAGTSKPSMALNYSTSTGLPRSMSAQVPVSADGKMSLTNVAGGSPINIIIDIQGYFTKTTSGGVYTPQTGRLIDTRNTAAVGPNAVLSIQVAGARRGVPSVEGGLTAVALTLTAINNTNSRGGALAWADGTTEPTPFSSITFVPSSIRSNMVIVPVGANGKINLRNVSDTSTHFVLDLQGTYNSLPTGPEMTNLTGSRASATNLTFGVSDQVSAQVDVATGNLMLTTNGLSLPGVTSSAPLGAVYNSRSTSIADSNLPDANRWQYAFAAAGSLTSNTSGVAYIAADGSSWQFTPTGATGAFTSPAGLQQRLERTSTEYVMTGWASNQKVHFNFAGQPTKIVDRNQNTTTFTYSGFELTKITSTAGPAAAREATVTYRDGTTTLTQTSGDQTRSVSYTKDGTGNITAYVNTLGDRTTFAYDGLRLNRITAPNGGVTAVTYDGSDRVTRVDQQNTTTGSPGTATTRLVYTSETQTLVADANTDSNAAVTSVPRTTYTLDAGQHLVTKAVDAAGREQSATYNAANNAVASSTSGAGSSASTTTGTFGANNQQSLTKVQSSTGSASSATYGSSAATAYLPATSTDSSSETTTYGYDGVGNQMSTQTGSGALSATAKLEYYSDGNIKTATAPANEGNPTRYTYDANKQLANITPPTGTSLGVKAFTYDALGRQATQTDGRGGTTTFTYDKADRLLSTSFSDGTPRVTNTYDANGNPLTQVSGTGTITKAYDQQNRLISTVNTAGGGTIRFAYDKASRETAVITATGSTNHTYDPAGKLTSSTYPDGAGTATQRYATDDKGRRTDTWLASNADNTTWAARTTTTYDASGRISQIRAWTGIGNTSNTAVFDTSYCYQAASPAPSCTATTGSDRDTIQWARDNLTGQATTYGYTTGRLTSATQTGGAVNSSWTYSYDLNGNRTSEATTGPNAGGINLTFNAASQITTAGYAYDGAGNLTASPGATYTYNGAQQMTSSTRDGVTTNYTYAGTDQNQLLTEKVAGGNSYGYVYGGNDGAGVPEIVAQTTSGAGTSSVLSDPVTGQALNLTTADGVTGLYLVDAIGNQVGLLTETRTTAFRVFYAPYGAQTVTAGATSDAWEQNPYGFKNGNRTDNGVLVKFGMRWYLAITGTWTQRDTLDAPLDPKNANRYGYAGGDPINSADPTGKWAKSFLRGFGAVTGLYDTFKVLNGDDTVAGFAAGALAEIGCGALAVAAGAPTAGLGAVAVGVACFGVGTAVGNSVDSEITRGRS